MSWWASLEKAGNISKLALVALKNAQHKIDEVLDIDDTNEVNDSRICEPHLSEGKWDPDLVVRYGHLNNQPPEVTSCIPKLTGSDLSGSPTTPGTCTSTAVVQSCVGRHTECEVGHILVTPLGQPPQVLMEETICDIQSSSRRHSVSSNSTSLHESTAYHDSCYGFRNLSLPDGRINSFRKSVSAENLTSIDPSSSITVLSLNTQPTCDIDVISCCNSVTGDNIGMDQSAVQSAGSCFKGISLIQHNFPYRNPLRGYSAPAILITSDHADYRQILGTSQDLFTGLNKQLDDDLNFAYHRVVKQLSHVKHMLSVREEKIIQLSSENNILHESRNILMEQLKANGSCKETDHTDVISITSEFSQRLADTERRLQLVCRERDQLKRTLASVKQKPLHADVDNSMLSSKDSKRLSELEQLIKEKNNQIEGLLQEGHKLSADQLKANNLLKKLRSDLKEVQNGEATHIERINHLLRELNQAQHELAERKSTITTYTANNAQQSKLIESIQKELETLKVQLNKTNSKLIEQTSEINALESENMKLEDQLKQLRTKSDVCERAIADSNSAQTECDQLRKQLYDCRCELNALKHHCDEQNTKWRKDLCYYQGLLSDAQSRIEFMSEMETNAAQPILQELEQVKRTLDNRNMDWHNKEQQLIQQLNEYQQVAENSLNSSASWQTQLESLKSELTRLQSDHMNCITRQCELQEAYTEKCSMLQASSTELSILNERLSELGKINSDHVERIRTLENLLQIERDCSHNLEIRNTELVKQFSETKAALLQGHESETTVPHSQQSTLDVQRLQATDSNDTPPSCASPISTLKSFDFPLGVNNQSTLEYLQAYINLRNGECAQLKREIQRLTETKESLMASLATESAKADKYAKYAGLDHLTTKFMGSTLSEGFPDEVNAFDVQQRHDALLILYGKLVEENNELRMDLLDVKEMYRAQIDMLLKGS